MAPIADGPSPDDIRKEVAQLHASILAKLSRIEIDLNKRVAHAENRVMEQERRILYYEERLLKVEQWKAERQFRDEALDGRY